MSTTERKLAKAAAHKAAEFYKKYGEVTFIGTIPLDPKTMKCISEKDGGVLALYIGLKEVADLEAVPKQFEEWLVKVIVTGAIEAQGVINE